MSVTTMPQTDGTDTEPTKKSRKKLLLVLVVVLAVAGAAYWFLLKPGGADAAEPVPGEVVVMEPIQVNLAEGHYLRIGVALQLTADVTHAADGSKALDLVIDTFSGRTTEELAQHKEREKIKKELLHEVEEAYHHEVMDLYFTEFVTQ